MGEAATMLMALRETFTLRQISKGVGYSISYVSDISAGRRLPSVAFCEAIAQWMGGTEGVRQAWHLAGARAHGWYLPSSGSERYE